MSSPENPQQPPSPAPEDPDNLPDNWEAMRDLILDVVFDHAKRTVLARRKAPEEEKDEPPTE